MAITTHKSPITLIAPIPMPVFGFQFSIMHFQLKNGGCYEG